MGSPGVCSVLSDSKTAGKLSLRVLCRDVVSSNWGANLRSLEESWGGSSDCGSGREADVSLPWLSGLARCLAVLELVSTGCGKRRRLLVALSSADGSWPCIERLLLELVSTGSGAKRRWAFLVVSTGWGKGRRRGGELGAILVLSREAEGENTGNYIQTLRDEVSGLKVDTPTRGPKQCKVGFVLHGRGPPTHCIGTAWQDVGQSHTLHAR